MPIVYNKHHKDAPPDAVYVGRPTKWGNPFALDPKKKGKDREAVLEMYKEYLKISPELVAEMKKELKNKDLVCWCAPKACHADVILEVANAE